MTWNPKLVTGKVLTEDARDAVIRCLTHELYVDAPLEEVADACETSIWVVKAVLDDMKLRRVLVHARMISEQLDMGLDEKPEAVITIALEHYFESQPGPRERKRDMRRVVKGLAKAKPKR